MLRDVSAKMWLEVSFAFPHSLCHLGGHLSEAGFFTCELGVIRIVSLWSFGFRLIEIICAEDPAQEPGTRKCAINVNPLSVSIATSTIVVADTAV